MLKMAHFGFNKGPFDPKGGRWPHDPTLSRLNTFLVQISYTSTAVLDLGLISFYCVPGTQGINKRWAPCKFYWFSESLVS